MTKFLECNCTGKCFAKQNGYCTILKETPENKCSFQKPYKSVTNGKTYKHRNY